MNRVLSFIYPHICMYLQQPTFRFPIVNSMQCQLIFGTNHTVKSSLKAAFARNYLQLKRNTTG